MTNAATQQIIGYVVIDLANGGLTVDGQTYPAMDHMARLVAREQATKAAQKLNRSAKTSRYSTRAILA